jgi:RecB family endonuclease NucS
VTRATIYTISEGPLTAITPAAPESEDRMQKLIADHPEIIADGTGALPLIRREQPIADREDGSGRWSLDHLCS